MHAIELNHENLDSTPFARGCLCDRITLYILSFQIYKGWYEVTERVGSPHSPQALEYSGIQAQLKMMWTLFIP